MSETLILALAILSSSFFGSWHCAAMCGPIASLMGAKKNLAAYHLGRFLSYVSLGIIAGSLGRYFLESTLPALRVSAALLLAMTLLLAGLRLVFPRMSLYFPPATFVHKALTQLTQLPKKFGFSPSHSGLFVGILTALLPCGWLYTYVIAAAVTKSPWAGALTMGLFWLGGVPALSAVPALLRKGIDSAGLGQQRIAGGILIAASLYSVLSFFILK